MFQKLLRKYKHRGGVFPNFFASFFPKNAKFHLLTTHHSLRRPLLALTIRYYPLLTLNSVGAATTFGVQNTIYSICARKSANSVKNSAFCILNFAFLIVSLCGILI